MAEEVSTLPVIVLSENKLSSPIKRQRGQNGLETRSNAVQSVYLHLLQYSALQTTVLGLHLFDSGSRISSQSYSWETIKAVSWEKHRAYFISFLSLRAFFSSFRSKVMKKIFFNSLSGILVILSGKVSPVPVTLSWLKAEAIFD